MVGEQRRTTHWEPLSVTRVVSWGLQVTVRKSEARLPHNVLVAF